MADREHTHAEQRAFDADAWGASPHRYPEADRSVYDDDELDPECVPVARSVLTGEADERG
jgi:hypothetical protein